MRIAGVGKLVGVKEGNKNGKPWMIAYVDDEENLMERLQLFVRENLINDVHQIPIGSEITVQGRIYTRNSGRDVSIRLTGIAKK